MSTTLYPLSRPSTSSTVWTQQSETGSTTPPPFTPQFHPSPPRRTVLSRSSTDPFLLSTSSPRRSVSLRHHFSLSSTKRYPNKLRRTSDMSHVNGSLAPPAQINGGVSVTQSMLEMASKRIQTLDYLRKSHEARTYWFNTLQITRPDLLKLPSYSPARLGRRAQNYLLLGFSLPMLSDLHAQTLIDYLKAFNALLSEFDTYCAMHPPDGSASSLSRARIPHMFKRSQRRNTEATLQIPTSDSGITLGQGGSTSNLPGSLSANVSPATPTVPNTTFAFTPPSEPLLPTEHYTHLLTPGLPFEPDFFETFATLCDVLIDTYSRVVTMIAELPETPAPTAAADLFAKADSKVKKVIVSGMVREVEEKTREGVRGEIAGIAKVVLGGMM